MAKYVFQNSMTSSVVKVFITANITPHFEWNCRIHSLFNAVNTYKPGYQKSLSDFVLPSKKSKINPCKLSKSRRLHEQIFWVSACIVHRNVLLRNEDGFRLLETVRPSNLSWHFTLRSLCCYKCKLNPVEFLVSWIISLRFWFIMCNHCCGI